jgi:hypothetical protein
VKEECLSRLILFGESSLRRALNEYIAYFYAERPHHGKGNVLLFPEQSERGSPGDRVDAGIVSVDYSRIRHVPHE